jgi:hypothetical protein
MLIQVFKDSGFYIAHDVLLMFDGFLQPWSNLAGNV